MPNFAGKLVKNLDLSTSIQDEASRIDVVFLKPYEITPNPLNNLFPITEEDVNWFKDNILEVGLGEALVVVKSGDRYRLLSGERRYRAIMSIFGEGKTYRYVHKELKDMIPVTIHEDFKNEDEEYEALIGYNSKRVMSKEDLKKLALNLSDYYDKKKADGDKIKGRKVEYISMMIGYSPRTITTWLSDEKQEDVDAKEAQEKECKPTNPKQEIDLAKKRERKILSMQNYFDDLYANAQMNPITEKERVALSYIKNVIIGILR